MDGRTIKFLIFIGFSLLSLGVGYAARRRGWLREEASRPIHYYSLLWLWSPVSLLSFWGLPMRGPEGVQLLRLMLVQPLLMVLAALLMAPCARAAGCSRG